MIKRYVKLHIPSKIGFKSGFEKHINDFTLLKLRSYLVTFIYFLSESLNHEQVITQCLTVNHLQFQIVFFSIIISLQKFL